MSGDHRQSGFGNRESLPDRVGAPDLPHDSRSAIPDCRLTVADLLGDLARLLAERRMADPTAEAREIVAALYDVPRFWPVMNRDVPVDAPTWERALRAAHRRAAGAPLAYAVGRTPFRHLTLDVDERVLIPRPETEQLVDIVLEAGSEKGGVAIDVGTGSGAIALALASEGRYDRVIGVDVSLDALTVARGNVALLAQALHCPVDMVHGSLLDPVRHVHARVVVSNPPYIALTEAAELPTSVRDWEPPVALFGGTDGMQVTARLVRQAAAVIEPGGLLALEVDARRASLVADLVGRDARFDDVSVRLDTFGRERFVVARRSRI